ncbi:hypothetical protein PIB30_083719 [Stylosanthes scabra]|uniref:Trichome birefringence-like N-terminal domain-containing protein n=1 Tax=Stylosanthes scabra TaxID=79078 RepID=A0ABU6WQM5_9FABA|nr:hypothetical protein [Stylosanthes scabra]
MNNSFFLSLLVNAFVVLCVVTHSLYQACGNAFDEKKLNQKKGCDVSLGNWVFDDSHYPLYDASFDCPFIVKGFDCIGNGRPDHDYLKYKWKPIGCDLPRWSYVQIGNEIIEDMDYKEAYKIGLTTWAKWIDSNIDHSKIKVLFQGIAASHSGGVNCVEQTQPEEDLEPPHPALDIAKSILSNMTIPVDLLDITLLTQLRIDGHPSIYSGRGSSYVDCSHWCLAGVPDTWNEMLYAALVSN